jgi:cbb3-type cytochrome oxidase subunit 3
MNSVLMQAADTASLGWILGVTTALFMVLFAGWVVWLWSPAQVGAMEDASRLPLEEK